MDFPGVVKPVHLTVEPFELRQVLEQADTMAGVDVAGDPDQRADLLQVVAPGRKILDIVVGVLELVQLVNRGCGVVSISREAGLLH